MFEFKNSFAKFEQIQSEIVIDNECPHRPIISIVIPTYRRPSLLIEAVRSALNQSTNTHYEVVVVDNEQDMKWSTQVDELLRELNSSKLRLFRNHENLGMFGNWNRCLELARGEWVSILNDDDLLAPDFLANVLRLIQLHPDAKLLQTGFESFSFDAETALRNLAINSIKEREGNFTFVQLSLGNPRAGCLASVYNRKAAIEIGGFNPEHFPTSDVIFNMRFLLEKNIAYGTTKSCALYRVQENESQKPHVLAGFIKNDFAMRLETAAQFKFPFLMKIYARIILTSQLNYLEHTWQTKIDKDLLPVEYWKYISRSKLAWVFSKIFTKLLKTLIQTIEEK